MHQWQLQDAKNKFSEVVGAALAEGPQLVTRRGEPAVVVVAYEEFQALRRVSEDESLYDVFRDSPLVNSGIDLSRQDEPVPDTTPFVNP